MLLNALGINVDMVIDVLLGWTMCWRATHASIVVLYPDSNVIDGWKIILFSVLNRKTVEA